MPYFLAELWKTPLEPLTDPKNADELWDHYEKCLIAHDWTFEFTDDFGVWRAGQEQRLYLNTVRDLCSKRDEERTSKLYFKYSFWHNEDGSLKQSEE